jgi:signal transduction histidine kinase
LSDPNTLGLTWFARPKALRSGIVVVVVVVVIIVVVVVVVIQVNLGQIRLSDLSNVDLKIIYKRSINNL